MKKPCPDLVALSDQGLSEFWQQHHPAQLKALGDRLLAESLPRHVPRQENYYPPDLAEQRRKIPMNSRQMSELLGVNLSLLRGWEERALRPPASLGLIYARLASEK